MTTWINIIVDDLYAYLAAPQVDAIRKCALAKNQVDPILEIIRNISLKIRAQISGNKRNILSKETYAIPPELKNEACILILEVAQTRIPGLKLTSDQVRLVEQARVQLQNVVTGHFIITPPDDPLFAQKKSIEVVEFRPRITTVNTLKGF